MSVRARIYDKDPYLDFTADAWPTHFEGFGSDDPVFEWAFTELRPSLVIEVGTWKGASAMTVARVAERLSVETEIVCVDTWLGSPEHMLRYKDDWYASLNFRNGYPHMFFTFMANVVQARMEKYITPFPATSENAAYVLDKWAVRSKMIYIDAAHEYEPVLRDLKAYWHLLSEDGLLIADDYVWWPGVTRAVDEFIRAENLQTLSILRKGKAVLAKRDHAALARVRAETEARGWLVE